MSTLSHDTAMSSSAHEHDARQLIEALKSIVGARDVLTGERATRRYRTGFRYGKGIALAVVQPATLIEQWKVLKACVAANVAIITQASNTGLTGGSTPHGDDYDRHVVIVSTTRIKTIHLIDGGRQAVCLPGATLDQLEKALKPIGREPHSVIGSSCIGASVLGGISNNSGGALVRRGPAYTELAVFAKVDAAGELQLVNHLGIRLGSDPEEILDRLGRRDFSDADIELGSARASDRDYAEHVRQVDEDTPARYNADPRRLYEASGCGGKLMVFAVRLDTFPMETNAKVFYIGTGAASALTALRRSILSSFANLPIAGEYLHRDAFDIAKAYGKDTFLLIQRLGTERLPAVFALKSRCDAFFERLGLGGWHMTDRVMQFLGGLFPEHLPARLREFRDRYEHHLILKVSEADVQETREFLSGFCTEHDGGYFECSHDEGKKAFLHRFVAAGAAIRYRAIHSREVEDIVALDIALRRNERNWFETLPDDVERALIKKLYYGHFLCHVFHQDYIVRRGNDCLALEHRMWKLLDLRGAEYPAEHNVGHLYHAKPELAGFYRTLDPCNCFNPGIGQSSKFRMYRAEAKG